MTRSYNFTWNDVLSASNLCVEKDEITKTVFINKFGRAWTVDDLNSKISVQNFVRFNYFVNADEPFILYFQNDTEAASIVETLFKPLIDSEDEETKEHALIKFLADKIIEMQVGFETENSVFACEAEAENNLASWKMCPVSKVMLKSLM